MWRATAARLHGRVRMQRTMLLEPLTEALDVIVGDALKLPVADVDAETLGDCMRATMRRTGCGDSVGASATIPIGTFERLMPPQCLLATGALQPDLRYSLQCHCCSR